MSFNYFDPDPTNRIAVVSNGSQVGVYDDEANEGVILSNREEVEWLRDALSRWLDDGGNNG